MPELITDPIEIEFLRQREYFGHKTRFICSDCHKTVTTVKIYKNQYSKPRTEHIGYWCRKCRHFFHIDQIKYEESE